MNARGIAAVALRIWSLVLLLCLITEIPALILGIAATPYPAEAAGAIRASQTGSILAGLVTAAVAVCVLRWAEWIARRAIPETEAIQLGLDVSQLLSLGLALLGAVTLLSGLEDAAVVGYVLAAKPSWVDGGDLSYLWEHEPQSMVRAGFKILAGVTLLLGRGGFARAWAEVRSVARTGSGLTKG